MTPPAHLFFYGVLREGLGEWQFLDGIGPGRPATAQGVLHAITTDHGCYPVMMPGEGVVHGACHAAGGADIAAMDAFEGADYVRRSITARTGEDAFAADAYVWISDLPEGAQRIEHGDFARWLKDTGNRPYSAG